MSLTIYQTFHKEFPRNENCSWIKSIGVNGFHHTNGVSDSSGQSISNLNPYYCELTAQYWAWKNSKSEFIGFYHYRRYLNFIVDLEYNSNYAIDLKNTPEHLTYLTSHEQLLKLKSLLSISGVIVPQKTLLAPSIADQYINVVNPMPWKAFVTCLKLKYPSSTSPELFFNSLSMGSICNIFVMHHDLFDKYCSDLFHIIDLVFHQIGVPFDDYNNRYPGFLSERFLGYWLHINNISPIEVPMAVIK